MTEKTILIIAGPNGAGKTTLAKEALSLSSPEQPVFVNADMIASGLSPFEPELAAIKAGRLMLAEMDELAKAGRNFCIETTLAGQTYVKKIRAWRKMGYRVTLCFLSLNTPEEAINRVASRVKQGGHSIPEETVKRRFHQGLKMFHTVYKFEVDSWVYYDNSNDMPIVIEEGTGK